MAPALTSRRAADRAFERIYRRHIGDVYRYAFAVLRSRDDAEDVTQTTFLNAYRAFQRGERPEQPKNWLITIAHNVCRQRFRQAQRRPQETVLFEDAAEVAVEEPEREYTADDIRRALGYLAFNQRSALVMRELEGRSYAEIASIMGLTVGAVETLIFRGRRALREQLEGSLTCEQAERALSKQTDGMLPRGDRRQLRAHLRECDACARFARRQRATRGALKALGAVPLPSSLLSLFGGGGASVGTGVAVKAAAVVCAGAVVGGVGYEGARHVRPKPTPVTHAAPVVRHVEAAPRHPVVAPPRRAVPIAARTEIHPVRPKPKPVAVHPAPKPKAKPTKLHNAHKPTKLHKAHKPTKLHKLHKPKNHVLPSEPPHSWRKAVHEIEKQAAAAQKVERRATHHVHGAKPKPAHLAHPLRKPKSPTHAKQAAKRAPQPKQDVPAVPVQEHAKSHEPHGNADKPRGNKTKS